jgi:hypothetical protein
LTFFTDENFIPKVGRIIRTYEDQNQVILFAEKFARGTPDVKWIHNVGMWEPKPVIVGGDGRILRNKAELRVLRETGCNYVYLSPGWTNTPIHEYAWKMLKYWPEIVGCVQKCERQSVVEISRAGKVTRYGVPS